MSDSQADLFQNTYRGKKVLITGHTGFKGAWLTQWLLELGADVCGYSIDIPTQPSLFEALGLEKKIQHHLGDIRDLTQMSKVFKSFRPEIVFHLAAQSLVRTSYDEPKITFDTNVGGTVNVLECLRVTESVRAAVMVATDKCYENLESGQAYRETDPLGGKDPYSASKACAEIACGAYQKSFFVLSPLLKVGSARAGNVIGGGDWAMDRLVPDCMRAWKDGKNVEIRSPDSVRPWQHVLEPVGAYLWLGSLLFRNQSPKIVGESFNFGPNPSSTKSVVELLSELKKNQPQARWKVVEETGIKKEAKLLSLNCDRAKAILKWEAILSFPETIRMTSDWYQKVEGDPKLAANLTIEQIQNYSLKLRHLLSNGAF